MVARDLQAVVYTDDSAQNWVTGMDATVFAQTAGGGGPKVGGSDYTGTPQHEGMPSNLRPRGVYVVNGTRTKFVVCLTNSAPLYTGAETSINLLELGSATPLTWTRHKPRAEKQQRARKSTG
jgi:hypothetical protein